MVGIGTGDCAYNIMLPWLCKFDSEPECDRKPKYVTIDKCLLPEIVGLWEKGIKTTGCCCGHDQIESFISVANAYIQQMEGLGYLHQTNPSNPTDDSMFQPKTILKYGSADKGHNWWD